MGPPKKRLSRTKKKAESGIRPNKLTTIQPISSQEITTLGRLGEATTSILRGSFASQVTANHLIQTGVEFLAYDLYDLGATNYGSSNLYVDYYDVQPQSLSMYVQDKMEYEGMIVNAGLRYDLYNPDGISPADPLDPLELNDDGTIKLDKSTYKVGLPIIKDPVKASVKHTIAPAGSVSLIRLLIGRSCTLHTDTITRFHAVRISTKISVSICAARSEEEAIRT